MVRIIAICIMCVLTLNTFAQKKRCLTDDLHHQRMSKYPHLYTEIDKDESVLQGMINHAVLKRGIIHIPVVVHVIYNSPLENISDEQVFSQIAVLNKDYSKKNADTLQKDHPFYSLIGNVGIHFFLATKDPNGNITQGITRTKTQNVAWNDNDIEADKMKFSNSGGINNWNPSKYLNIYVVRFSEEAKLLGYAWPPQDLKNFPETDGVVIDFRAFGTVGAAGSNGFSPYMLGRTATHEVGHWLNLDHIWGDKVFETDKVCGDDKVADTPPAESDNAGVPVFPYRANNKCGSNSNGEMYMNYMDYVHDEAMNMFTKGQASRIVAAIQLYRTALLSSTLGIENAASAVEFSVSPNPSNGMVKIDFNSSDNYLVEVKDVTGKIIFSEHAAQNPFLLNLTDFISGCYYISIRSSFSQKTVKIIRE